MDGAEQRRSSPSRRPPPPPQSSPGDPAPGGVYDDLRTAPPKPSAAGVSRLTSFRHLLSDILADAGVKPDSVWGVEVAEPVHAALSIPSVPGDSAEAAASDAKSHPPDSTPHGGSGADPAFVPAKPAGPDAGGASTPAAPASGPHSPGAVEQAPVGAAASEVPTPPRTAASDPAQHHQQQQQQHEIARAAEAAVRSAGPHAPLVTVPVSLLEKLLSALSAPPASLSAPGAQRAAGDRAPEAKASGPASQDQQPAAAAAAAVPPQSQQQAQRAEAITALLRSVLAAVPRPAPAQPPQARAARASVRGGVSPATVLSGPTPLRPLPCSCRSLALPCPIPQPERRPCEAGGRRARLERLPLPPLRLRLRRLRSALKVARTAASTREVALRARRRRRSRSRGAARQPRRHLPQSSKQHLRL